MENFERAADRWRITGYAEVIPNKPDRTITADLPTIHQLTGRMGKPDAPLIGTYLDE